MNRASIVAVALAAALGYGGVAAAQNADGAHKGDNTAQNAPARSGSQPTADEQSNSKADIELTARIRRSVMEDKTLSVYGKNVKIVSSGGKVTLNGAVRSDLEKQQIGMKASEVAGAGHVVNDLKVAPAD